MSQPRFKQSKSDPKERGAKPPFDEPEQDFPGREDKMRLKPDHGEQSYRGAGKLAGKSALITGGDSGIGRAVAIAFAREGADLVISYLPEEEADARETVRWVEGEGRKAVAMPGDVQDEQWCRKLVDNAVKECGKLDLLVNNAAYQMSYESLEEITSEELDRTFRTNLYSMFYLCKAAVPRMKPGSAIINTASIQAFMPSPELLAYAPTKAAIVNFTKALSKRLMKEGIRVNAVAPGPVWTPLIPSTTSQKKTKDFGKNTAFERPAQPAELAPLFVFLASQDSSYMTGEVVGATGGKTPL
ncbi:MAG TPA: SDR family oxidoreductase [Verrucomicrobiae bacterium]|nr:SDR family oxidoreductase [Verrucomicrobiae bacterium]